MRRGFVAGLACAAILFAAAPAQAEPITKLSGPDGCVAEASSPLVPGTCTGARGLEDVTDVAVSPDGRHAYSVAHSSNSLAAFDRASATGALRQLGGASGCLAWDGDPIPGCGSARGLIGPTAIAITHDGANLYVTGFELDPETTPPTIRGTLLSFARDPASGALTQLAGAAGCTYGGAPPVPVAAVPGCTQATFPQAPTRSVPLGTAIDVEASSDGKSVVTASFLPSAVINWSRDKGSGVLTPRECLGSTRTLLPTASDPPDPLTDVCNDDLPLLDTGGPADGLAYPTDVEIAPDASRVYAAALGLEFSSPAGSDDEAGSIARFDRNPTSGELAQPASPDGCVGDSRDPVPGCENARTGLLNPFRVAVSPDGGNVYVGALNVFPPDGVTGPGPGELSLFDADLAQLEPPCLQQFGLPAGGLQPTPGCQLSALGLVLPSDIAFSPDGTSAFVSSLFHAVASFDRDQASGALVQDAPLPTGCSIDPRNLAGPTTALASVCQNATPLNAPTSIEVSPDGRNAYVTSGGFLTGDEAFASGLASAGITSDDAIVVFGPTPAPTQPPPVPEPVVPATCGGLDATIVAVAGRRVIGTEGDDVVAGTPARDRIRGGGGADLICGGGEGDRIRGGGGNDDLRGGGGKDQLRGNSGRDRLAGGPKRDRLSGGGGKDRCRPGGGRDRLRGCES